MRTALIALLIASLLGGQVGIVSAVLLGHRFEQARMVRYTATASAESADHYAYLVIPEAERFDPTSSFARIDEREFFYRGKLYDIVHEEHRGTDWHVWALHDRAEERYLKALERSLEPMLVDAPAQSSPSAPKAFWKLALLFPPSMPMPLSRSHAFPRWEQAAPEAPCLAVPHPPPQA